MDIDSILAGIESHLARELGDVATAHALTEALREDVLSWRAPEIDPAKVDTIVAFTFGNRMLPNGNRLAGPVNKALGDVAVLLHQQSGAPIFAQWEVAEAVGAQSVARQDHGDLPGARRARRTSLSQHFGCSSGNGRPHQAIVRHRWRGGVFGPPVALRHDGAAIRARCLRTSRLRHAQRLRPRIRPTLVPEPIGLSDA